MKAVKKLSIFAAVIAAALCLFAFSASAYVYISTEYENTGIFYRIENGEAVISGADNKIVTANIPSEIDSYPVTRIDDNAFSWCDSLTSVTIPDSVTNIGSGAFSGTAWLDSKPDGDVYAGKVYYEYKGTMPSGTKVVIKSGTKSITGDAFRRCTGLTSVTIPNSVISIGDSAFSDCTGLTSITIPDSVTSIGNNAFDGCYSLTSVTIGNSVTSIGDYAFFGCDSLEKITVDKNNSKYASLNGVLFNKKQTTLIQYPAGKADSAYTIPNSVTSIGDGAFYYCTGLTSIAIPNSVTSIGYYAFQFCYSLTSVTIPDGVTSIGYATFWCCFGLTSVSIPDSVTSIGADAFYYCYRLTSVTIGNGVTSIGGGAFHDCYRLTSVTIGNSVTSIGGAAFKGCNNLTSVTIPDSVTNIDYNTFSGCSSLTSVIIPDSVISIENSAFAYCYKLEKVYYTGTEEQWKKISIGFYNECLTDAEIIYNFRGSPNTTFNSSLNRKILSGILTVTPYSQDSESVFGFGLENTTVSWGSKSATTSAKTPYVSVPKNEIGGQIEITEKNHRDYIIHEKVAAQIKSYSYEIDFAAHLTRKDKDKYYISSVIGKKSKSGAEGFVDLRFSSVECSQGETADIYITSCGLTDPTYYISQDNAKKISSRNGEFTAADIYSKFDFGATIVAYAVGKDGKTTQPVEIKLVKKIKLASSVEALTNMTKMSLIGSSGTSFAISDNFPIIGGTEIDFSAFKVPIGVEVEGSDVRISFGFDFFESKKNYETGKKEKEWKGFKDNCNGIKKASDDSKESYDKWKKNWNKLEELKKQYGGKNIIKTGAADKDRGWTCSALGYIEAKFTSDGKLCFKEGSIIVSAEFSFKYSQQTAVWVIPAYYYFELGAEGTFDGKVYKLVPDRSCPIDWAATLGVEPKIAVGGGAGIVDFASAGLRGEGSLPIKLEFRKGHLTIDLKGALYAEGQFLFLKGKKKIIDGTMNVLDRNLWGVRSAVRTPSFSFGDELENNSENETSVTVLDRKYLKNTSSWRGSSSGVKKAPSKAAAAGGIRFADLQTSVYNQSQPQVVTVGSKQVMVYVADNSERDDCNRLYLMYSVNENGAWSTPKPVYDDGHNDASPSLATDGTKVYLSWQKVAKKLTAADCESELAILENTEIYLAEFDGATNSFKNAKRITNNSAYDYLPFTAVENGNVSVYYAEGDPSTQKNSVLRYSDSSSETVKSDLPYVNALSAANGECAYSVDEDPNDGLTSDISVFTVKNGKTAKLEKYSDEYFDSSNSPYNLITYGELDGKQTLFASDGTYVYYQKDGKTVRAFSTVSSISGYLQAVKTNEGLTLLWLGYSDDSTEIFSCSYENGAWGEPVRISSQGDVISFLDANYANGIICGVCNITESKFNETIGDYELGRTDLVSFAVGEFSDLSISAFAPDETQMKPGEEVSLSSYITQNGTRNITSLDFTVTDGLGTNTTYHKNVSLSSGATVSIDVPYTVPENYKGTTITVSVGANGVTDKNNSDNKAEIVTGSAKITINDRAVEEFDDIYILPLNIENHTALDLNGLTLTYSLDDCDEATEDESATISLDTLVEDSYNDIRIAVKKSALVYDESGFARINISVKDGENEISSHVSLIEKVVTECHHPLTEKVSGVSATCTEKGRKDGKRCTVCKKLVSGGEEIPALGHKPVTDKAVYATCTKNGKTAGKHCSVCGTVITAQKTVKALGHKSKTTTQKATVSKDGKAVTACTACGKVSKTVVIYKASSVKLSKTAYTYNGKAQKPKVTVKNSKGKALVEGKDYTVKYQSGRKNPGQYTVTVTFKGEYSGKKTLAFTISPKAPTLKVKAGAKKATLLWNKQTGATGYTVYMATSKNGKYKKIATVKNGKVGYTKTGLKKGKTYYFKVAAYTSSGNKTVSGACSATKSVKVK